VDWLEAYKEDLREVFSEAERIVNRFPSPIDRMASAYLEKFSVLREGSNKNYICYLLPFWTREATNLDAAVYRRLSLANVFVMLHFFIQDDLMDSKTPNCRDMLPLANFMQHEYMNIFRAMFPPESLFWHYYQTYLSEWADAVIHENDRDYFAHESGKLAHKASPVKLASTGSFLLAEKPEFIPMVSQNVDAALVTLQMVDDYADWQEDMSDGAYNSLVSFAQNSVPEQPITESLMRKLIYDRGLLDAFAELAVGHHRSLTGLPFKLPDIVSFHHSLVESLTGAAACIAEEKKKLESGGFYYYLSKIENSG
jgi:hypothetical protein